MIRVFVPEAELEISPHSVLTFGKDRRSSLIETADLPLLRALAAGVSFVYGSGGLPPTKTARSLESNALSRVANQLGCRTIDLDLLASYDFVFIDRGWGGVAQNALDIWAYLNRKYRALLVSPIDPPFSVPVHCAQHLITPTRLGWNEVSLQSVVILARSLLKTVKPKLTIITHRAMAPYFYDLMDHYPFVIHGDQYGESVFASVRNSATAEGAGPKIQELLFGSGEPWISKPHASALYLACVRARENWAWTPSQLTLATQADSLLSRNSSVVPPMIDLDLLETRGVECAAPRHMILFTTTTHGVSGVLDKGLKVILDVADRLPVGITVCAVLSSRSKSVLADHRARKVKFLFDVPKPDMAALYKSALAVCRLSAHDSVPISVLEAMASEAPVLVSPAIGISLPRLQDGVNCFVVDASDVGTIVDRISCLASNASLVHAIGSAARECIHPLVLQSNLDRFSKYLTPEIPSTFHTDVKLAEGSSW